jgi:hypothetical protein
MTEPCRTCGANPPGSLLSDQRKDYACRACGSVGTWEGTTISAETLRTFGEDHDLKDEDLDFILQNVVDLSTWMRSLIREIKRRREGSAGWRSGIEASIRRLQAMARKPRDLWKPAYFVAVDEALVHLGAMLERGTEQDRTVVQEEPSATSLAEMPEITDQHRGRSPYDQATVKRLITAARNPPGSLQPDVAHGRLLAVVRLMVEQLEAADALLKETAINIDALILAIDFFPRDGGSTLKEMVAGLRKKL